MHSSLRCRLCARELGYALGWISLLICLVRISDPGRISDEEADNVVVEPVVIHVSPVSEENTTTTETTTVVQEGEWFDPYGRGGVQTIFFQGTWSSQTVLARYCGSRGFPAPSTAQTVRIVYSFGLNRCIDVIHNPSVTTDLSEISHTLTTKEPAVLLSRANFGQQRDIQELKRKYKESVAHGGSHIEHILFGTGRGAAAIINALPRLHDELATVKLIVLEACYISYTGTLARAAGVSSSMISHTLAAITDFDPNGPEPLSSIHQLRPRNHWPVFAFITSEFDDIIPPHETDLLVNALRMRTNAEVYILRLHDSPHDKYATHNDEDKHSYTIFMHALYQHLGLVHIPEHAKQGLDLLKQCRVNE